MTLEQFSCWSSRFFVDAPVRHCITCGLRLAHNLIARCLSARLPLSPWTNHTTGILRQATCMISGLCGAPLMRCPLQAAPRPAASQESDAMC